MQFLKIVRRVIGVLIIGAFVGVMAQALQNYTQGGEAQSEQLLHQVGTVFYLGWMIAAIGAGICLILTGKPAWQFSLAAVLLYLLGMQVIAGRIPLFSAPESYLPRPSLVDIYWFWLMPMLCFLDVVLPPYRGRRIGKIGVP